jgi:hypothetical protein
MSWLRFLNRRKPTATEWRLLVRFDLSGWTDEADEEAYASWSTNSETTSC